MLFTNPEYQNATEGKYTCGRWDAAGVGMDRPERNRGIEARKTLRSLLGRFAKERSGVAAIEFSILALPFFLLIFAILECCIAFVAQEMMANAVDDVSRQLRTGQLDPGEIDEDQIHEALCSRMRILFPSNCPELRVDLRNFASFRDASREVDGGLVPIEYKFDPGPAASKNVIRVFHPWPVITDILRDRIASPDGTWMLFATATWQNEPFHE